MLAEAKTDSAAVGLGPQVLVSEPQDPVPGQGLKGHQPTLPSPTCDVIKCLVTHESTRRVAVDLRALRIPRAGASPRDDRRVWRSQESAERRLRWQS